LRRRFRPAAVDAHPDGNLHSDTDELADNDVHANANTDRDEHADRHIDPESLARAARR
jgi:hypothetical protein